MSLGERGGWCGGQDVACASWLRPLVCDSLMHICGWRDGWLSGSWRSSAPGWRISELGMSTFLGWREGGWEVWCILTPLGLRCSTSDTPGITRLLQLVGRSSSEALTSHLRTGGGTVRCCNQTPGTAGGRSSFWLCAHAQAHSLAHTQERTAFLGGVLITHTPSAARGLQR